MTKDGFWRTIVLSFAWYIVALLFSAMFASIETNPYAQGLPTWRPDPNLWWVKVLYWVPNLGRPVNGLDTFALLLMGAVYFLIFAWDMAHKFPTGLYLWFESATYFVGFNLIEDWVWYALNPNWGWHRFNAASLPTWMYHHWLLGFPSQYWEAFLGGFMLLLTSKLLLHKQWVSVPILKEAAIHFAVIWGSMIVFALITALIADSNWIHQRNFTHAFLYGMRFFDK